MLTPSPVKIKRIRSLLLSHKKTFKEEGINSVPSIIKDILSKFRRSIFTIDKYYLYEKKLLDKVEICSSRVKNVKMEIIFLPIPIEVYEMLGEMGYDFRKHPEKDEPKAGNTNGTFIFLGIKDNIIIFRSCISNFRNGVYLDLYPEKNDSEKTCYQGFNWTHPKFRKMGLYTWAQTFMFNYMKNIGFESIVMLEPEDQIGPRKVQDRLGSQFLCESFAFRLLFFINYRWNKPQLNNNLVD